MSIALRNLSRAYALITYSFLATTCAISVAQYTIPLQYAPSNGIQTQLTASQMQTVQNMTSAQISQYQSKIQPALAQLRGQIAAQQMLPLFQNWQDLISGQFDGQTLGTNSSLTMTALDGTTLSLPAIQVPSTITTPISKHQPVSTPAGTFCPLAGCNGPPIICCYSLPIDLDQDGLPDNFETLVANQFTPYYQPSTGEQQQFATFGNYVPMTVTSLVGTVPPFSYFRVQPLGLAYDSSGAQLYALRVDYLNLWNADGGLIGGGGACLYNYVGLDSVINQLSGHDLDAERSGMLIAAPAVNGGYNPDPTAYNLYTLYTAAHEGTFFDQSYYISPAIPVASGNHPVLDLSVSKHSTYTANPDYLAITPQWFIQSYFSTFLLLYVDGDIDYDEYLLSIAIGTDVFYGCVVERYRGQPGSFANQRVNVGEPAHPINGSLFIQDDSSRALNLTDKLTTPLFY